jgi:hypothetical protein
VHPAAEGQEEHSFFDVVTFAASNRDIVASSPSSPHLVTDFMNLFLSIFDSCAIFLSYRFHLITLRRQFITLYCYYVTPSFAILPLFVAIAFVISFRYRHSSFPL